MKPVLLKTMGTLPEVGRIRTGVKSGKAMKAIDTFRFTSTSESQLQAIAGIYGGEVEPWHDAMANPPNQYQLITEASTIKVVCQPNSVDVQYEMWSKGGRQRACDGEVCEVSIPKSSEYVEQPCMCAAKGQMECRPHTRVNLIIPDIPFSGTWRYESKGMSAAHTYPVMMQIIDQLRANGGLLPVDMTIVDREVRKHGQTRKFKVVEFHTQVSVNQMLTGGGNYSQEISAASTEAPALAEGNEGEVTGSDGPATPPSPGGSHPQDANPADDDDIVDAEIVEDPDPTGPATGLTRDDAMRMAREQNLKIKKEADGSWTVS